MLPFVSVILPVRNERAMLPRLLDHLLAQNYPPDRYEILVVDGRSTDGTADLVRRRFCARSSPRSAPIRLLDNPGIRSAAGRNIGLRASHGDVILFIDGHCAVPSHNLIEDSVAILERTGAGCLCRPEPLLAPSATDMGEIIAHACAFWLGRDRSSRLPDGPQAGFVDPVCSGSTYRRSVFEHIGLYDESFESGEDIEFNARVRQAGIAAYTDPRLAVLYQPRPHIRDLFHERLRSGRARIRLLRRHPDSFSAAQFAPLALLLSLPLAAFAWWLLPLAAAAAFSLPLACFVAALAVASVQMGARCGSAGFWFAPFIFSAMWLGSACGLAAELLRPAQPRRGAPVTELLAPREILQPAGKSSRAA